jgi:hypothetical protein
MKINRIELVSKSIKRNKKINFNLKRRLRIKNLQMMMKMTINLNQRKWRSPRQKSLKPIAPTSELGSSADASSVLGSSALGSSTFFGLD